ncbi:hypothetical protein Hanom_Chr10g00942061 [Helianthus anomalus]
MLALTYPNNEMSQNMESINKKAVPILSDKRCVNFIDKTNFPKFKLIILSRNVAFEVQCI